MSEKNVTVRFGGKTLRTRKLAVDGRAQLRGLQAAIFGAFLGFGEDEDVAASGGNKPSGKPRELYTLFFLVAGDHSGAHFWTTVDNEAGLDAAIEEALKSV